MSRHGLRLVFGSKRGWRILLVNSLAAFGLLSAGVQFYGAVWGSDGGLKKPGYYALATATLSLAYGFVRAYPRRSASRHLGRPDVSLTVKVGDLFEQEAHLVVGFCDTFDTDTTDNVIIAQRSVQGQLTSRLYGGDASLIDEQLAPALSARKPARTERETSKAQGKRDRYPIGTVAVLGEPGRRRIFAVAYTKMGNNLVAQSTVNDLWHSLGSLWTAVYEHGQRGAVAMPIVGSELARIDCVDRESLLKMILLSFVSRSREQVVCKELVVVVHPPDLEKINMLEIQAFMNTL